MSRVSTFTEAPRVILLMTYLPMLYTTQGVVLHHIKYRETSIIAKIFTEVLGLQTYIIQGVRAKTPKHSIALFQPLTRLDMVVYHKKQSSIQRVSEVQHYAPNNDILANIKKAAIAIFLAELLSKVIREEEHNEQLFNFLWLEVMRLNEQTSDYELFYLYFMLQLSHYLGFGINSVQDVYTQLRRSGQHWDIDKKVLERLDDLLTSKEQGNIKMDKHIRRHVTELIIKFYQLHIESLNNLKSLKILQEIG
jgi:DNA repair protein RecO (recombination protein O)